MKFERVTARALASAGRAAERKIEAIAEAAAAIGGVAVERRGRSVVLSGRGLVRRSIEDIRLRFVGRAR